MSRSLMGSRNESREISPVDSFRKTSTPCISYLALTSRNTRKSSYKHYGAQKTQDTEKAVIDPSLLYKRPPARRGYRASSEGPSVPLAPLSRQTSSEVIRKKSCAMFFLPQNNESPVMVLKKHSQETHRKESFDSGIGMQEEDQKRKKKSRQENIHVGDKEHELKELYRRVQVMSEKMMELSTFAEKIQQSQRNSSEFQMQLLKQNDASELEKGVSKVLEMIEFDRQQELVRLRKKTEDFLRRVERRTTMVGDQDELRDLIIAASELEKKTAKGFEEVSRLELKTDHVEVRQKEHEKVQRLKREKIAMANGTMQTLLTDAKVIDGLLQEVRDYQIHDLKIAENNCEEFISLMGEKSMGIISEDLKAIEAFKKESEVIREEVWEDRLESNKIQTALVDQDQTINVKLATKELKGKISTRKRRTCQLKNDYEDFIIKQKAKYDVLLKEKRAEAEKIRLKKLKEEEERKKKEAEERELARLKAIQDEEDRKKREEEERLRQVAEEERKKKAEEERLKMVEQLRIKSEIQQLINKEAKNLQQMQQATEDVELQQREVELIHEKRRELCTDPRGLGDEKSIEKMLTDFTEFSEGLQNNEESLIAIGKKVFVCKDNAEELLDETLKLCDTIKNDWGRLNTMKVSTDKQLEKQKKQLTSQLLEIRRREDEAAEAARKAQEEIDAATAENERMRLLAEEQRRLLEEEERRRKLREEEEAARYAEEMRRRKLMEEEERLRRIREEEEERLRREAEEAEMRRRQLELEEMQRRLAEEQEKIEEIKEEWKTFTWDDKPWDGEYAGELIGFLSNPALLFGIKDPKKIAEILRRAKEMALVRARMREDAKKLAYICKAIEELQIAAKEAEERRWARQNREWTKDVVAFRPADLICSTANATFTPTNFLSLEESRRQVVARRISREQMAPVTLQELAKHSDIPAGALDGNHGRWSGRRAKQVTPRKSYMDRF